MRAGIACGVLSWIVVLSAAPAIAQRGAPSDSEVVPVSTLSAIGRKAPSFWNRPSCSTPEDQLRHAQSLEARGRLRAARRAYQALVRNWHDRDEAVTAQASLAAILERREKWRDAFDEYQYLVDQYAGRFSHAKAVERQFRIAVALMEGKGGGLPLLGGVAFPERAVPLFERVAVNAPGGPMAAESFFRIGRIHEERGNWEEAAAAYETVNSRYAKSPFAESAAFRRAQCLAEIARRAPRDETECRRALSAFALFRARFPDSPHAPEAAERLGALNERLARMYYDRAAFYDRAGNPRAAVLAYTDFLKQFPSSSLAVRADERIRELSGQPEGADERGP